MINNVLNFPQVTDVSQIKPASDVPAEVQSSSGSEQSKNETGSDLSKQSGNQETPAYLVRLSVDQDPETGDFIYKSIDRVTGEVVRIMPSRELLKLRQSGNYQAGSVIKTDV
ncbi:MAG: flagellar biosynthesis protein FlaG [Asticcacaulis sp.]|uniref:flagellar biosynthesis protein FlaG n=1 Tax=Asticcacaulis sp. TaxID=1872648 RepID=UPI0039E53BEE